MPGRTRVPVPAAALAAIALLAPRAAPAPDGAPPGDPAETERRIAAAGAPAALRARIHGAIGRGADWLAARVAPGGGVDESDDAAMTIVLTGALPSNPLSALALARAGTESTRAATERAAGRLLPEKGGVRADALTSVPATALLALLAAERKTHPDVAAALGDRLATLQDPDSGWWLPASRIPPGYVGLPVGGSAPPPLPDIDATSWAAFGLAAAESGSGRSWAPTWRRLAESLLRRQAPDGGWAFGLAGGVTDPGSTAQGAAALALASRGVLRQGAGDPDLARRIAAALDRARPVIAEDAADGLWYCRRRPGADFDRTLFLMNLAHGLALADVREVDGRPWFQPLAEALLAGQSGDGSWPGTGSLLGGFAGLPGIRGLPAIRATPGSVAATAVAILVLARSVDPPVEGAADAATPPTAVSEWPDPDSVPPTVRVPIAEAEEGLDWLERLLAAPASRPASIETALRFAGRAYGNLVPGSGGAPPAGEAEWRRRAEHAFLRAAFLDRPAPAAAAGEFRGIRILAARLIGLCGPSAVARFRRALKERWFRAPAGVPSREEWRAAFASLARVGDDDSLAWLTEEALSTDDDGPRRDRGLEALRAVASFKNPPGRLRRRAAERVIQVEMEREQAASLSGSAVPLQPLARVRWAASRRWAIDALHALCRDPITGKEPLDAFGAPILTVGDFQQWVGTRSRLRDPPWRDR